MRPKKKILLVADGQTRSSLLKYVLATWGYAVTEAVSADDAGALIARLDYDLVICEWGLEGAGWLMWRAKRTNPRTNTLMLMRTYTHCPEGYIADEVLCGRWCTGESLRETVRVLAAGHRGPLPMVMRKPVVSVNLEAALRRKGA